MSEDDICRNYHGGNEESEEANPKRSTKEKDRASILNHIENSGPSTCDEMEVALDLAHQTASARCSELKREGILGKIGTRPTRTGCSAAVLGFAPPPEPVIPTGPLKQGTLL